jgi:hypothetical protein
MKTASRWVVILGLSLLAAGAVLAVEPPRGDVIEKILRGHRRAAMVGGFSVGHGRPNPA